MMAEVKQVDGSKNQHDGDNARWPNRVVNMKTPESVRHGFN